MGFHPFLHKFMGYSNDEYYSEDEMLGEIMDKMIKVYKKYSNYKYFAVRTSVTYFSKKRKKGSIRTGTYIISNCIINKETFDLGQFLYITCARYNQCDRTSRYIRFEFIPIHDSYICKNLENILKDEYPEGGGGFVDLS